MDLQTAVAASMLPGSRSAVAAAFKDLHRTSGDGAACLECLWAAVRRADVLGPAEARRILDLAGAAVEQGRTAGIEPVPLFDPAYPALLRCIADPPPVLWVRGVLELPVPGSVAIVGSRAASAYALEVGGRLAAELAGRGIAVVSGLARGVDSAAHRGCLDAGGWTVAVLGAGVDRIYPAEHAVLADEIAGRGMLMAELAPGAPPLPEHFPLRNRIISGIALATVVVEASERSGSLITARCALEQGRDVMAVPGSVLSGRNRGSHALLKDGARVVETADDILQELGWSSAAPPARPGPSRTSEPLLAHMEPGELYDLDELASATGLSGARLLTRLTDLELAGMVAAAGGRFMRRG